MAKVTKHKKSVRGDFNCVSCFKPVVKGEEYYMWSLKSGSGGVLHRQHVKCGQPKRSQLTLSRLSGVYSAIEDAEASIIDSVCFSDIQEALDNCVTELEQVRDEYQEGLDNMPEGLQEGSIGQGIGEKIEAIDSLISTIQGVDIPEDDSSVDVDTAPEGLEDAQTSAQEALDEFEL